MAGKNTCLYYWVFPLVTGRYQLRKFDSATANRMMETIFSLIASAALITAIFQLGLSMYNRWFKNSSGSNEVSGIIFSTISLIYSLLMAFVIIAVWNDYEELNSTIEKEADKLINIIINSSLLSGDVKHHIYQSVDLYCHNVLSNEWTNNSAYPKTSNLVHLRVELMNTTVQTERDKQLYAILNYNLNDLIDLRRARLHHVRSHVPEIVWVVLIISSILVLCFCYCFQLDSQKLKRVYLAILSSMVGMCLFLIYMLDHPFTGSSQVSNEPYYNVLRKLKEFDQMKIN